MIVTLGMKQLPPVAAWHDVSCRDKPRHDEG
jgi:hypothetical protein